MKSLRPKFSDSSDFPTIFRNYSKFIKFRRSFYTSSCDRNFIPTGNIDNDSSSIRWSIWISHHVVERHELSFIIQFLVLIFRRSHISESSLRSLASFFYFFNFYLSLLFNFLPIYWVKWVRYPAIEISTSCLKLLT